jgi:hypothetical protein
MADTLLTQSLITVAQNYRGDVVRQINRIAPTLALMAPTFFPGEGPNIAWVASSSGAIAETFAEGADVANFGSDSQIPATIPWARYRSNYHVSGSAIAVAKRSRSPLSNIQLWAEQYVSATEVLAKMLGADIFTGAGIGSNALTGLDSAIGSQSNTYAGIVRSGNPPLSGGVPSTSGNDFWSPYLYDASTNPGAGADTDGTAKQSLTQSAIRYDQAQIALACGEKPDLAIVGLNTFNWLRSLFDPQMFYMMSTEPTTNRVVGVPVNSGPTAGGGITTIQLDAGVGRVHFDGTYFVADPWCPAGTIYYINTKYWKMEALEGVASLDMFPTDDEAMATSSLFDGYNEIPFSLVLQLLAITGDSFKAMLKTYPQIAITRPNAFGKRINITQTG